VSLLQTSGATGTAFPGILPHQKEQPALPNSNIIIIVMVQEMTSHCTSLAPAITNAFHTHTSRATIGQQIVTNMFPRRKGSIQAAIFLRVFISSLHFNSGREGPGFETQITNSVAQEP
jgi:hypothetical protein